MKINKEELYNLYIQWVNEMCELVDTKTHFTPKEIVHAIAKIIETNPTVYEIELKEFHIDTINPYIIPDKQNFYDTCPCNPKNGGSGICGCIMGTQIIS